MKSKKIELNPVGLRQDESVANFNAQYLFDAKNIRIEATSDNSQTSITNERGTNKLTVIDETEYEDYNEDNFLGIPIGYEVLNNDLIIFTTENTSTPVTPIDNNVVITLNDLSGIYTDTTLTLNYSILGIKNYSKEIRDTLSIQLKVYSITDGIPTLHTTIKEVTTNYDTIITTIPSSADKVIITEVQISTIRNSVPFVLSTMNFPITIVKNSGLFNLGQYTNKYFPAYTSNTDTFENAVTQDYSTNAGNVVVVNGFSTYDTNTKLTRVYNNSKYILGTYQYLAYSQTTGELISTESRFTINEELSCLERDDTTPDELYTYIEFTELTAFEPPIDNTPTGIATYNNPTAITVGETLAFKWYILPENANNRLVNISFNNTDLEITTGRTIMNIDNHELNVFIIRCNEITDDTTTITVSSDSNPEIFATYIIDKVLA